MKLTVIKSFTDKLTGELRRIGEIIDVDAERGNELLSHPLNVVKQYHAAKPTKDDLLDEVERELTNKELAEAIEKAKASPEKPNPKPKRSKKK